MYCPKAFLSLAYLTACCIPKIIPPIAEAPSLNLPIFKPQNAGPAPSPTLPSKFSTGTLQSVKYKGTVDEPSIPIFFSSFPISNPGVPFSTTMDENFPSILSATIKVSAHAPFEIKIF